MDLDTFRTEGTTISPVVRSITHIREKSMLNFTVWDGHLAVGSNICCGRSLDGCPPFAENDARRPGMESRPQ